MTSESTRHRFASAGSRIAYKFLLPAEWTVEDRKNASSFLLRDGEAIGEIPSGSVGIDLSPLSNYPKTGIGGAIPHFVG